MSRVLCALKTGPVLLALLMFCGCRTAAKPAGEPAGEETTNRSASVKELGPVKVTAEVDPPSARLSDEPKLTVTIDYAKGVTVEKPPFGESTGDFRILDFHEPLPKIGEDREEIRQVYTLEPTRTGDLFIWPIAVQFTDTRPDGDGKTHIVETEGLTVRIAKVSGEEAPSLDELQSAAAPMPISGPLSAWVWITSGVVLAGIAVAAVWFALHKRKKEEEIPLGPGQLAYLELQRLIEQNLAETDVKLFYVELTGIVRRYIERTTGIRAPEQTTEEFLREISETETFDRQVGRRLRHFLESADLVKFAAYSPRKEDIEEAFYKAKVFIGLEQEKMEVTV